MEKKGDHLDLWSEKGRSIAWSKEEDEYHTDTKKKEG
jgi:hypothetical protein